MVRSNLARIALAAIAGFGVATAVQAQSVFDTLSRSKTTERWLILPGEDSCGATHRPSDGSAVLNGQPSYSVKRAGGRVLSFSPKQAGTQPLDAGTYTIAMGKTFFDVSGEPWSQGAPGLRLAMPPQFTAMLADGGALSVIKDDRQVLTFQFGADFALQDELRKCLGGQLPQN